MADPLTALMYAVQVMNFLRMLILRTLRGREDSVLDSTATHLEPPDESGHQSPSQPCLRNTATMVQVAEQAEQAEPEFVAELPVLDEEDAHFSDGDAFSLSLVKKLLPNEYGASLNAYKDKEAVAGNDLKAEVVILTEKNRTCLSNVSNLKDQTNKLTNQNTVFRVFAPVPVQKRLSKLSCINSSRERIEAWR